MKHIPELVILISVLVMVLAGCSISAEDPTVATRDFLNTAPTTQGPTTEPTTEPTTVPTAPPKPLHSDLYIPGLEVDDVILYFNEVCLDAEYSDSGSPNLLQRWDEPIYYQINGHCTDEDEIIFGNMVAWLNGVNGFPGMFACSENTPANLDIYFCDADELAERMGEQYSHADGAVTFWYDENIIFDEIICYRNDIDQYTRNSVILEEIYNGLGPVQDTSLREDSLIYSGYSEPQWMTEIDELLLKLLYHPMMEPGMNAEECEVIIRELYY